MQLTYIGLEPKSFHTIKYSQPLELVLFHFITYHIKFLKGSYYPHLLNNYLIFSGVTNYVLIHTIVMSHQPNIELSCIPNLMPIFNQPSNHVPYAKSYQTHQFQSQYII